MGDYPKPPGSIFLFQKGKMPFCIRIEQRCEWPFDSILLRKISLRVIRLWQRGMVYHERGVVTAVTSTSRMVEMPGIDPGSNV